VSNLFRIARVEDARRETIEYALGPLVGYVKDARVQNICFNGGDDGPLFVQFVGRVQEQVGTMTRVERERAITYLATASEPTKAVDETMSRLRCDLPFKLKGRVQALAPPIDDWVGTIRMHAREVSTLEEYAARGELVIAPRERIVDRTPAATPLEAIRAAVRRRDRIFIVGSNGAGKTTTMNTVMLEIAKQFPADRVALIQDNRELQGKFANQIEIMTLVEQIHFEMNGVISRYEYGWLDALHDVLRMAIKRIMWGELREKYSAEGLLTASYAGIVDGFVTTLHANSVRHTFTRLEHLLPRDTPREMIGEFVDFIIYCEEYVDGCGVNRYRIADLGRSFGFDPERKQYIIEPAVVA
jgi:Flp pilus assembly CpaF family ATPase